MITIVLILAGVGFFVLAAAIIAGVRAALNWCDWFERGNNPFDIPIDEFIQLRICAGTLRPDGKRWTAEALARRVR